MQYVIRNCYDSRDHEIHASAPRPSMFQCVDDEEAIICPGGRVGDRRIRQSHDIANLYAVVRVETVARELAALLESGEEPKSFGTRAPSSTLDEGPDEPPEPDFDEEYEADRAADRYERDIDSRW